MALAGLRRLALRRFPLPDSFAIAATLLPPPLTTVLRTTVLPRRPPPRPTPRRLATDFAAVPRQRMPRPKQPLTSLHETPPPTAAIENDDALPRRLWRAMLMGAQGSDQLPQVKSRRGATISSSETLFTHPDDRHQPTCSTGDPLRPIHFTATHHRQPTPPTTVKLASFLTATDNVATGCWFNARKGSDGLSCSSRTDSSPRTDVASMTGSSVRGSCRR